MEAAISSAVSLHFYATCSVMTGKTIFSIVWHNLNYGVDNRMNLVYIQILTLTHENKEEIKYCLKICTFNLQRSDNCVRSCVKRSVFFSSSFCDKLLSLKIMSPGSCMKLTAIPLQRECSSIPVA